MFSILGLKMCLYKTFFLLESISVEITAQRHRQRSYPPPKPTHNFFWVATFLSLFASTTGGNLTNICIIIKLYKKGGIIRSNCDPMLEPFLQNLKKNHEIKAKHKKPHLLLWDPGLNPYPVPPNDGLIGGDRVGGWGVGRWFGAQHQKWRI